MKRTSLSRTPNLISASIELSKTGNQVSTQILAALPVIVRFVLFELMFKIAR